MSIGKSLATLRRKRGWTYDYIAGKLSVTRQAVARWEKNESDPTGSKLDDLARLFDVSISSLFSQPESIAEGELVEAVEEVIISIEQLDLKACCGQDGLTYYGTTPQTKLIKVNFNWYQKNLSFYKPENIKVITAIGDSMSPTIEDGDLVFVDVSQVDINRDGIFFLLYDNQYFLKRIQRCGGGRLLLISDNRLYRDLTIEPNQQIDVRLFGRVVMSLKPQEFR